MVDVHDIDALLISALYGELTPADEARLAAHLESHPTDRTALDDLTRARSLVKDSRILAFQLDPPQAVSALLLQEAARRAPAVRREPANDGRESWFFRFVRSFAAHPAMAAAAMLVLVVGAAGVMKMRDHGDFAEPRVETRSAPAGSAAAAANDGWRAGNVEEQTIAAPVVAAARAPAEPATGAQLQQNLDIAGKNVTAGSGAGYTVGLADADEKKQLELRPPESVNGLAKMKPTVMHAPKKGIDVTTPQLALKEDRDGDVDDDAANARKQGGKAAKPDASFGRSAAGPGAAEGAATPPPPPPVAQQAPAPKPEPPADKAAESDRRSDATLVAWANAQLKQVVQLAKDNKCDDAAKVASTISSRAPEFYAQNVATNRELKQCMAYIAAAHDRAEKAAAEQRASKMQPTSSVK